MSHGHKMLSKIIGCPGKKNLVCHILSPSLPRVAGVIQGSECSCPHLNFSPPCHHQQEPTVNLVLLDGIATSSFLVSDFWPLEPCSSFWLCPREENLKEKKKATQTENYFYPQMVSPNIRAGKLQTGICKSFW